MAKKKLDYEIISYTYKTNGKIHTATVAHQDNTLEKDWKEDTLPLSREADPPCNCGQTKCLDGQLRRCMDVDGEGTCIWFITNEPC